MTGYEESADADRQHHHIWEQLPWYVNQTLPEAERTDVERHLTLCADCQAELTRWQQIATAVQRLDDPIAAPRPEQFDALMARIDVVEPIPQSWWSSMRAQLDGYLPVWRETPSLARLALAAQAVVIVLLAGAVLWRAQPPQNALYQTLSSEVTPTAYVGRFKLIFAPDTTERDMRQLLTASQATVIAGPSPLGVYTVEVPLASDAPNALTTVLEAFRVHRIIQLAEPVPRS